MDDFDERELVARCQRGDDSAFAELVDRYKNLVYAMIYRMMTDRTQVEDLAQDVFLKVHRGLPYFRGEARLSTWIYRIVANVCVQARSGRRADAVEHRRRGAGFGRRRVRGPGAARPDREGDGASCRTTTAF